MRLMRDRNPLEMIADVVDLFEKIKKENVV
jgi:hypothetical protein